MMTEAAMTDVQDLTLDEVRALLADGIASNAAFDGWGDDARDMRRMRRASTATLRDSPSRTARSR